MLCRQEQLGHLRSLLLLLIKPNVRHSKFILRLIIPFDIIEIIYQPSISNLIHFIHQKKLVLILQRELPHIIQDKFNRLVFIHNHM